MNEMDSPLQAALPPHLRKKLSARDPRAAAPTSPKAAAPPRDGARTDAATNVTQQ